MEFVFLFSLKFKNILSRIQILSQIEDFLLCFSYTSYKISFIYSIISNLINITGNYGWPT